VNATEAQSTYLDARGRAMAYTTPGLRLAAWRLRRRQPQLDATGLVRLRAVESELAARRKATATR
jgi:hypothetical protein